MKTLYNCESENCCAYCKKHNCGLTVRQVRAKNCLQKQCWHMVKNEEHSWWKQREVMKSRRVMKKKAKNGGIYNV